MNVVALVGRLCADPEIRDVGTDKKVCEFRIAVNRTFKRDEADFFNIITWNKQAEIAHKYLNKGSQVGVYGRVEIQKWQDKEGNNRYTTNIIANDLDLLGSKKDTGNTATEKTTTKSTNDTVDSIDDDDLPFM